MGTQWEEGPGGRGSRKRRERHRAKGQEGQGSRERADGATTAPQESGKVAKLGSRSQAVSTGLPSQEVTHSCFRGRLQVVPQSGAAPERRRGGPRLRGSQGSCAHPAHVWALGRGWVLARRKYKRIPWESESNSEPGLLLPTGRGGGGSPGRTPHLSASQGSSVGHRGDWCSQRVQLDSRKYLASGQASGAAVTPAPLPHQPSAPTPGLELRNERRSLPRVEQRCRWTMYTQLYALTCKVTPKRQWQGSQAIRLTGAVTLTEGQSHCEGQPRTTAENVSAAKKNGRASQREGGTLRSGPPHGAGAGSKATPCTNEHRQPQPADVCFPGLGPRRPHSHRC